MNIIFEFQWYVIHFVRKIANIGILIFCIFYLLATYVYSGGHSWDHNCTTFSWACNYWCDLTASTTYTGLENKARYLAFIAMIALLTTSLIIWFKLNIGFGNANNIQWAKYTGIISIFSASTVATQLHDFSIYFGGFFGLISFTILLMHFWKSNDSIRLSIGLLMSSTLLFCIVSYTLKIGILWLPIAQKTSMVTLLIWFIVLNNDNMFAKTQK